MKRTLNKLLNKLLYRKTLEINIKIEECRHYCGFKYGNKIGINHLQDYIVGLKNGENKLGLRKQFIHFLSVYRPQFMSDALNVELGKNYPLWALPWGGYSKDSFNSLDGWIEEPIDVPDIVTHYSKKGVYSYRIEEEFVWCEAAYRSIFHRGYLPLKYDNPISVNKFVSLDGRFWYLLLDGNHRVAALHAKGEIQFKGVQKNVYYEKNIEKWSSVKAGFFAIEDARSIFYAYLNGNIRQYYEEKPVEDLIIID
jgi:hypothetical protein